MIKLLERDAAFQYYLRSLDADCGAGQGEGVMPNTAEKTAKKPEPKPFVLGDVNGLWRKSCNPHRSEADIRRWQRFPKVAQA